MNQALQEYKKNKREAKIEKYSFIALVAILTAITFGLEILWIMKLNQ